MNYQLPESFSYSPNAWHLFASALKELNQNLQNLNSPEVLANTSYAREILHNMLGLSMMIESLPVESQIKKVQQKIYDGEELEMKHLHPIRDELNLLRDYLETRPYYDVLILGEMAEALEDAIEEDDRIRKVGQVEFACELETYISDNLPDIILVTSIVENTSKFHERMDNIMTRYMGITTVLDLNVLQGMKLPDESWAKFLIKSFDKQDFLDEIIVEMNK